MNRSPYLLLLALSLQAPAAPVLPQQLLLDRETWWDNRDWAWYKENIPFFDCPDRDIVTTYYYRWELVTKHLVEGNTGHGYAFTEFMDRPFWSGTYGAISCPAGHQLYEVRWLRKGAYAQDYARYWHAVPGAQPRNYSTWLADATWAVHAVQEAPQMLAELYEPLQVNHAGWEKKHFVPEKGMFWQHGHDDGMEFNINSRQTKDLMRGGNAFRPTLNAYLWADSRAIANIAELLGKTTEAAAWAAKAAQLKEKMQQDLWDPKRQFFFPRAQKDEVAQNGQKVAKGTLTYESGEFAGSDQGRELIGYVPWQFSMPDAGKGYEAAWKFLMQPDYFAAPYGPTTVGRKDPLFYLNPGCCWWSGRSWPYATAQTLTAMANLLQDYEQDVVQPADYVELLRVYAQTHRKNGKPYLAEAADPFTGSWEGHDGYFHSEHYFHSSYCDLVLSGLMGLDLGTAGKLVLHPLFPETWEYCAVDNLKIRNREVAVLWDKSGTRYGKGKGLRVLVDGRELHAQADLRPVRLDLAPRAVSGVAEAVPEMNLAINQAGSHYPELAASHEGQKSSASTLSDGQYWYSIHPPNRWTTVGQEGQESWLELDFGTSREFHAAELFLIDDQNESPPGSTVALPKAIRLQEWQGAEWKDLPALQTLELQPDAANLIRFAPVQSRKLRLAFTPAAGRSVGLSELRILGPKTVENLSAIPADANGKNLAKAATVAASHTSRYDKVQEANDGVVQFKVEPRNRWTSWESETASDWLEFSWSKPQSMCRLEVYLFDDRGGVQAPSSWHLESWDSAAQQWTTVPELVSQPQAPKGNRRNTLRFKTQVTDKLRLHFQHGKDSRSGVTEVEVYAEQ